MQPKTAGVVRFAEYALDLRTGELHRNHIPLKLQPQPAKVLVLLVRRAGELSYPPRDRQTGVGL